MQEEVNQKTVALSIRTTKLTGKVLAAALGKVVRALQKHHQKALTPQGRQSVKKLMNHYLITFLPGLPSYFVTSSTSGHVGPRHRKEGSLGDSTRICDFESCHL